MKKKPTTRKRDLAALALGLPIVFCLAMAAIAAVLAMWAGFHAYLHYLGWFL